MSETLIQSYVQSHYFVSTIYRSCSAPLSVFAYYYETMVWNWNPETRERGEIVATHDSGFFKPAALTSHAKICLDLAEQLPDFEAARDL